MALLNTSPLGYSGLENKVRNFVQNKLLGCGFAATDRQVIKGDTYSVGLISGS